MKPIAVTGLGFELPGGKGWDELVCTPDSEGLVPWPDTADPPHDGAQIYKIAKLDATKYLSASDSKILNRCVVMAVNSAGDALRNAGYLNDPDPKILDDMGCIIGTSRPEFSAFEKFVPPVLAKTISKVNPLLFPLIARSAPCGQICIQFSLRGYSPTIGFGPISGLHAVARSLEVLGLGRSNRILVGGVETLSKSSLKHNRYMFDEYYNAGSNQQGSSFYPSEGACFMVLECLGGTPQHSEKLVGIGNYSFGKMSTDEGPTQFMAAEILKLLEAESLNWLDISFISSSASRSNFTYEESLLNSLRHLCNQFNHWPILTAPKMIIGEAEACASMIQVINAVQYVRGEKFIGQIAWPTKETATNGRGIALVIYLDRNGNYFLLLVGLANS